MWLPLDDDDDDDEFMIKSYQLTMQALYSCGKDDIWIVRYESWDYKRGYKWLKKICAWNKW